LGNRFALALECLHEAGQRTNVVEDQAVGDQVMVLDDLALLIPAVLGDDAFAAEERPFREGRGTARFC
jgi:hypothetical protein